MNNLVTYIFRLLEVCILDKFIKVWLLCGRVNASAKPPLHKLWAILHSDPNSPHHLGQQRVLSSASLSMGWVRNIITVSF